MSEPRYIRSNARRLKGISGMIRVMILVLTMRFFGLGVIPISGGEQPRIMIRPAARPS